MSTPLPLDHALAALADAQQQNRQLEQQKQELEAICANAREQAALAHSKEWRDGCLWLLFDVERAIAKAGAQ